MIVAAVRALREDSHMTSRGQRYLGFVMAAGLIATLVALYPALQQPTLDGTHIALLLGLAAFAGALVFLRFFRPTRQATSGVSTLILFSALLLTAPQTVMLVLAVEAVDLACSPRHARPPWFVIGFNTSQTILAAMAAHLVNLSFHLRLQDTGPAAQRSVLGTVPAILVFFSVSYALIWGAHRFVYPTDGGFLKQLKDQGVEEAALLMIAGLARAAWAVQPWLILLACGPLILFWRLYRSVGQVEQANTDLLNAQEQAIDGLVQALAARDNEVAGHSQRVAHSTSLIARALGVDPDSYEFQEIVRGALLHDIGKIGVRDAVLHKPGKLTPEEWVEMRDHARGGSTLVQSYPFLAGPARIVLAHHERWDGAGYPTGLKGEKIPLGSRIFAVADTFDAITSPRPYKLGRSVDEAVTEIQRCSNTQFDPKVVDCFLQLYPELPLVVRPQAPAVPAAQIA
ncbi:MAG: HD-GYP domain-containing protein [Dehalococcoidia bacterium]